MSRYDDVQLDDILRDFLRDRADDTDAMATASAMSTVIGGRVGRGPAGVDSFGRLVLIGVMIALALAAIGVAIVGQRSLDLRGTVTPGLPTACDGAPCPRPELFAGLPYHLVLPDPWIGGSPETYASNVAWFRATHPDRASAVPATHPDAPAPGSVFEAYDTDVPGMRLAITGPSTVPADTDVEREIAVWESGFSATGNVDRVVLPAGEARRAREGPAASDGYLRITYLVVVGRDMYDLRFTYDGAVDRTEEIAALAATFRVEPNQGGSVRPSLEAASSPTAAAGLPAGARITGVVPLPNTGALTVGQGGVWVIDRGVTGDTVVEARGRLIKVDPSSLATSVAAERIVGAQVAIGNGSAWIASPFRDRLLRVDLASHHVGEISTGTLTPQIVAAELQSIDQADDYPYAVVVADGAVWVANHHAGSVARFDARTGQLVATIPVIEPGGSGPANLATDGKRVWVTASRSSEVVEIDPATNTSRRRYDVAPAWACGGSTFDGKDVWVTSGHDQADPCHEDDAWSVSRVDPSTGAITHVDVGGRPMDVAVGLGAVWVVVDKPHPALVRLDPGTLEVVGRLPLGLVPNVTNPMEIGEGSIWIRVVDYWDSGMSPWPGLDPGRPSVLRIMPVG